MYNTLETITLYNIDNKTKGVVVMKMMIVEFGKMLSGTRYYKVSTDEFGKTVYIGYSKRDAIQTYRREHGLKYKRFTIVEI